jgi:sugar lactone lactonase YvrE
MLYHIDIDGLAVHRWDPGSTTEETRALDGRPGSIALTHDEDILLVASEHGLTWLSWSTGRTDPWIELEDREVRNRLNDGRCDRNGRFWVGSMDERETGSTGLLHRVEADGTSRSFRDGIGVANGLGFSPAGTTMYFADSPTKTVVAFDYDMATGTPSNERVLTDFSDLDGLPDGAAVDADGCYWIACYAGSSIARLTPSGSVDRIVEVPVRKPTMPAFGGPGLETMFVTSIGGGGSHRRPSDPGVNGMLLAVDVGIAGLPEPIFGEIG